MNNILNTLLHLALIASVIYLMFFKQPKEVIVTEYISDTTSIVTVDTNSIIEPYLEEIKGLNRTIMYNDRVIADLVNTPNGIDTVYEDRVIYLPVVQKTYTDDTTYKAWVSGVNPVLDSINVYQKTEYKTITNTVRETIYAQDYRVYINGGFNFYNGQSFPVVSADLIMPSGWKVSAGMGSLNSSTMYEVRVGKRIFGN